MAEWQHKPGALVIKGEPSATDAARLRRTLSEAQKTQLRQVMRARIRGFQPAGDTPAVDEEV